VAKRKRRRKASLGDSVNHQLAKVLAKPQRVGILAILAERMASPKEISEEIGEDIGSVGHHIEVLRNCGLIELEQNSRQASRFGRGSRQEHWRAETA
jgi:DNA-binding transcriptional ArsR family regulator